MTVCLKSDHNFILFQLIDVAYALLIHLVLEEAPNFVFVIHWI